jgi:dipeptidyl aminopeptidase/acylaminoacyl peptidase
MIEHRQLARLAPGSPGRASGGAALLSVLLAVGGLFPALGAQEKPNENRPLQVEDYFRIKDVGNPRISPDGEWVAFTVRSTSLEEGRRETRIWRVPFRGGEPLSMTLEGSNVSSPAWSPDGRYLSFLATRGDSAETQVWAMDRRMGEGRPLTDVEHGVRSYEWSPDGTRLLLSIRDPDPVDTLPEAEKPDRTPPWEIDRLQFKRDRVGYITGNRHTRLYVYDLTTEELTLITPGDYDASSPAWSPDGTRVAFVANRTENPDGNSNTDIWVVEVDDAGGNVEPLQITTNPGSDSQPAWSPDGEWIAHVTVTEPELIWYAVSKLAVAPSHGSGRVRILTAELDRNVRSPRFSTDGESVFVRLEDSGENHLARVEMADGRLHLPLAGHLSVGGYDLGPDDEIVAEVARLDLPGEVFAASGEGGLRQLTRINESFLEGIRLGEVVNTTFPSADGTEIEGFFYLPPGHQETLRYPTILRIHGGPVSQYSHSFNFEAHLFAAHGYVVVTTNPRGSSGYGQEFSRAIWADWGNKDYEDVMAGVDYAIERGWADPDRLGVGGWSYGGILTDHVITKTDRFEAAITGASEFLYVTNYGHDHYQLQWELELGLPWESREAWERISPFNRVDEITTPTLVMGGEKDWNVPINNGEQLYQALRRRGVETRLVVYPGQSHGIALPRYRKDLYERYLGWYDKYVKKTDEPADREGR